MKSIIHSNVVSILGHGTDGQIIKGENTGFREIIFIKMEYIEGDTLSQLIESTNGLGEEAGRYFMG